MVYYSSVVTEYANNINPRVNKESFSKMKRKSWFNYTYGQCPAAGIAPVKLPPIIKIQLIKKSKKEVIRLLHHLDMKREKCIYRHQLKMPIRMVKRPKNGGRRSIHLTKMASRDERGQGTSEVVNSPRVQKTSWRDGQSMKVVN